MNKTIDVVPSPFATIGKSTGVCVESRIVVVHRNSCGWWIGIEIIVEMNTVYIVPRNNIGHHAPDVRLCRRYSRIEYSKGSLTQQPLGVLTGYMGRHKSVDNIKIINCAEWIHPCVQFYSSPVAFIDHKLQRIPNGC